MAADTPGVTRCAIGDRRIVRVLRRLGMTDSLPSGRDPFPAAAAQTAHDRPGVRTQSTRDHEAIRRWAAIHGAEPATGEATVSGPATIAVNDGAPGVRFNFPGFAPFRPIVWEEWLAHFDRHQLLLVYEEQDPGQVARRAHELFAARDGQDGRDRDDWFQAEKELQRQAGGASPSVRYRIVKSPPGVE